jgi:hypothetical protein
MDFFERLLGSGYRDERGRSGRVPRIDEMKDSEEEVERKGRQYRQQLRFNCDRMRTTLIFRPGTNKKTGDHDVRYTKTNECAEALYEFMTEILYMKTIPQTPFTFSFQTLFQKKKENTPHISTHLLTPRTSTAAPTTSTSTTAPTSPTTTPKATSSSPTMSLSLSLQAGVLRRTLPL